MSAGTTGCSGDAQQHKTCPYTNRLLRVTGSHCRPSELSFLWNTTQQYDELDKAQEILTEKKEASTYPSKCPRMGSYFIFWHTLVTYTDIHTLEICGKTLFILFWQTNETTQFGVFPSPHQRSSNVAAASCSDNNQLIPSPCGCQPDTYTLNRHKVSNPGQYLLKMFN